MASMVDELRRRDMLKNSGVEMYSTGLLNAASKAPKPAAVPAQASGPGLIQRAFPNTVGAFNDRRAQIDSAKQAGGYGAALGQSARTIANPMIGFVEDSAQMVKTAINPAAQALKTFATGDATPIGQEAVQNPLVAAATKAPTMTPQQMERTVSSGADPVRKNPLSPSAQPAISQVQPGIYQHGRGQFSDSPDGMGFSKGFTGQPNAQNNAAAEQLAARRPLVQAAQEQGPQNLTPKTSGSGYGLLDQGARDRRSALMDAQSGKPGAKIALASLLKQQADVPNQEIARDRMAQDGQERAADRMMRSTELQARLGESAADRALRSQELSDVSLTNRVKRDAAGVELGAAKQLADLRTAYLNAKTPEEQAAAVSKLNALSGNVKGDEYMAVSSGQSVDPVTGMVTKSPDLIINRRTGMPVQGQGQQAQSGPVTIKGDADFDALPSGAVYIGPDGKKYRKP